MKTIIFLANRGYALKNSRLDIISHFLNAGWKVIACVADGQDGRDLQEIGVELEIVPFSRGAAFGYSDVRCYFKILSVFSERNPDLVQAFHAKPVILSALAAKNLKDVRVSATITGLGHAFVRGGFVSKLAGLGYRVALPSVDVTIFQNSDDRALFLRKGWLEKCDHKLIVGSGVDVARFKFVNRASKVGRPIISMLGRLLAQKGVNEFIEVADTMAEGEVPPCFLWAGEIDPVHPDAVAPDCFERSHAKYYGHTSDVSDLLGKSDLFLFPSYREGVPRAIMEASASGLPTVAFDVPGVREVVQNGVTGFLVPFGDVKALSRKVKYLIDNRDVRLEMGKSARYLVESCFDIQLINEQYIKTYQSLGIDIPDFKDKE